MKTIKTTRSSYTIEHIGKKKDIKIDNVRYRQKSEGNFEVIIRGTH